ncbi:leucine-rich repeat-containing protein 24-like, partial [Schistocerca serialis cubense]|uniref:leucine-rich repeat-containing protein 24-like n=1 Tax=Schistocerca serialis cubense TaxID=2023355 RepID=UPI00214E96CD
ASGCPPACECKWRSGKEAAWCRNVTAVPAGLDAGTQLLDLSGNALAPLAARAFVSRGLAHLQRLHLARCGLRALAAAALAGLANLVELDVSGNLLLAVPSAAFQPVPELRELRLSANPLDRLPARAFHLLPRLVRLELSNCRISRIDPRAFEGVESSLEWLRLDGNELTGTESGVSALTTLRALHGLALAGNPWNCSCALRPLRSWLTEQRVPLGDEPPTCREPARLRGRAWDRLSAEDFACRPRPAPPPLVSAQEGGAAQLRCPVSADPPPTVKWLWRGRPLVNRSSPGRYVVNASGGALTVLRLEASDAGSYQCVGENRAGRALGAVTLEVRRRAAAPPPAAALSGRVLAAGVAVAALLVLAAGLLAACALHGALARKRRRRRHDAAEGEESLSTQAAGGCDSGGGLSGPGAGGGGGGGGGGSYEKIELNHKPPSPRILNHREQVGTAETAVVSHPRMREYRGVPDTDDEDEDVEDEAGYEEDEQETTTPSADLHIPRINSWDTTPSTTSSSWVQVQGQLKSPAPLSPGGGAGADSSQSPLLGASQLSLLQRQPPPSPPCPARAAADLASYDYHAQQLERFLMEYRSLQRQLSRMKMAVDRRRGLGAAPPSAGATSPPPYWLGTAKATAPTSAAPQHRRFSGGDFFLS